MEEKKESLIFETKLEFGFTENKLKTVEEEKKDVVKETTKIVEPKQ